MIGLIKMFGDRSRIRKVTIVENGAAMLPKASVVEMALVLSNVLFAPLFAFNEIDKVYGFTVQGVMYMSFLFLEEVKV